MKRLRLTILSLVFLGPARADQIQFAQANAALAGNTSVSSPYAGLTIVGNTTAGVLTFTLGVDGNPAKFTDLSFNLAPGVGLSDFTAKVDASSGGDASGYGLTKGRTRSSFGRFDVMFGPPANTTADRLSSLTFELDFAAGKFGEAIPSNVEVANSGKHGGNYFALEYFPNSGNTGFVGTSDPSGFGTGNTVSGTTGGGAGSGNGIGVGTGGDPGDGYGWDLGGAGGDGSVVPEPSALILMSLGGLAFLLTGCFQYLHRRTPTV